MFQDAQVELHRVKLWTPPVSYRLADWVRYLLLGERGATGTSISDFLENELLDHVVGNSAYSPPANLYFSLFTAAPSDSGGGTEVSGGAYARATVAYNLTQFPAASGGSKSNANTIQFADATANWGNITHGGVHDAVTVGNLLFWGALTQAQTINVGGIFRYLATKASFALD